MRTGFPSFFRRFSLPTTRAVARLTIVAAALSMFIGLTASARAQNCANRLSQDLQHHPTYSSTLPNLLSTAGNDAYIYEATEWGYVRASLSNPASPSPLKLIQVGQKTVLGGTNGGLVYQFCDCNQGPNSFAAADAPDGSSRMMSDWVAPAGRAHVWLPVVRDHQVEPATAPGSHFPSPS